MSLIQNIFAHNWWATLLVNFKLLPMWQAVKFPIAVYHRFRLTNAKGRIILHTPNVRRGMIKDFSDEESYCLYAGRPAKVVQRNKKWEV